jgi:lipopolysaccharide export system protein LptA
MTASKFKGMRNREAARYARWSAAIAAAICVAVIGVYLQRRMRGRTSEKKVHPVPAAVAQQSAGFTISRAIGPRTIFTVHASQATEFKDQNRSLLENVDIAIYGPRGDRNDSVHAGECSYEPTTGSIRCQGVVQIDLRNSAQEAGAEKNELHLETANILFEHDSGRVSTENPVTLKFPGGQGTGTGLVYEPQTEDATLEKNVQLEIQPPSKSNAAPARISGSRLEFRRSQDLARISGPVHIQQDDRTLATGALELQLNAAMQPTRAVATGSPEVIVKSARGSMSLASDQMTADFASDGVIEKISADQHVGGDISLRNGGEDHLSAQHAQIVMNSDKRQTDAREVLAQGGVSVEMTTGKSRGNIATESLRVVLAPNENGHGEKIESAESLAPAKLTMSKTTETDEIEGGDLSASFGVNDEISSLRGASSVRVNRTLASKPPETSTAENLVATFDSDGGWRTIDEKGNVTLQQGTKRGAARSATMVRAADEITLNGAASVDDSSSHLQADEIHINQAKNELRAHGNVTAAFAASPGQIPPNPQAGAIHISADEMSGTSSEKPANKTSPAIGHVIFSGHGRMWEGSDVLQAKSIEFWQSEQHAEARGDVMGEFVEVPHSGTRADFVNGKRAGNKLSPVLWQVRAPQVDYWGAAEKMEWTGGVDAHSSEGNIQSRNMEMFFTRAENNSQVLERAIATGGVRIEQNGRTGMANRGEYIARDGKFILSGGRPTLADGSGNTATGRELTFFLANDTILIDSQNGARTITKHRAEK